MCASRRPWRIGGVGARSAAGRAGTWPVPGRSARRCTRTAQSSMGQSAGNSPRPSRTRRLVTSPVPVMSRTCARGAGRASAARRNPCCCALLCMQTDARAHAQGTARSVTSPLGVARGAHERASRQGV